MTSGVDQDAARFFTANSSPAAHIPAGPTAFDLSALNSSLPTIHRNPAQPISPWASDFLQQQPRDLANPQVSMHQNAEISHQPMQMDVVVNSGMGPGGVIHGTQHSPLVIYTPQAHATLGGIPRNPGLAAYLPMSRFVPVSPMQGPSQKPLIQPDRVFDSLCSAKKHFR